MPAFAQSAPWTQSCAQFNRPYHYAGIYPSASAALEQLAVTHRIVRGINAVGVADPAHDSDAIVEGVRYTAAVDLSVKCLDAREDIAGFLGALADAGFIAWYRNPGSDGWPPKNLQGEPLRPHVHAVWVGAKLKAVLQVQVTDWLAGKNGLEDHAGYAFWHPSDAQKDAIRARFETANSTREDAAGQSALAAL